MPGGTIGRTNGFKLAPARHGLALAPPPIGNDSRIAAGLELFSLEAPEGNRQRAP